MDVQKKMPVVFAGHGSPMNAIGNNRARREWVKLGSDLGKPRAIVACSAHWATKGTFVRTAADNPQINDMYGFPDELYSVHYEPKGDPLIAQAVLELLGGDAGADNSWGIDHGVWSVLSNMYPDADVPIVMISTDVPTGSQNLFDIGRKLAPLREEGVLVFASGNVVHNLGLVGWNMDNGYPWADAFDKRIEESILTGHFNDVLDWSAIPDAEKAVPTTEHFDPLLVALGAADPSDHVRVFNGYRELGSMSMTSYLFES